MVRLREEQSGLKLIRCKLMAMVVKDNKKGYVPGNEVDSGQFDPLKKKRLLAFFQRNKRTKKKTTKGVKKKKDKTP